MGINSKFFVVVASALLGASLQATDLSCVLDIYLQSQSVESMMETARASAFEFKNRQQLPTKSLEEPARFDKIRTRIVGVPKHLQLTHAKAGQPFLYFFAHRNMPHYYPVTEQLRKLILQTQKIVAGPGSYVNVDSASGNFMRETYASLTGVFVVSTDVKLSPDKLTSYGEPLWVELHEGTPLVEVSSGLFLIPGLPDELTIPVRARSVTDEERARILERPIQVVAPSRGDYYHLK